MRSTRFRQARRPGRAGASARPAVAPGQEAAKADITLRIAPVTVELAPDRVISTIGYNGTSPGPVLRMREGVPVTVDVVNDTDVPEQVHWHGLLIPPEVDGAEEEGTPPVPPHGRRRYQFTPRPAGTRWYHTHTMAMTDLHRGSYTGQFGFLMVESGKRSGPLRSGSLSGAARLGAVLHQQLVGHRRAEPEVAAAGAAGRARHASQRPGSGRGASTRSTTRRLAPASRFACAPGQRVLMHLLNASAIENRDHRAARPSVPRAGARRQPGARRRGRRSDCFSGPASASTRTSR